MAIFFYAYKKEKVEYFTCGVQYGFHGFLPFFYFLVHWHFDFLFFFFDLTIMLYVDNKRSCNGKVNNLAGNLWTRA